MIVKNLLTKSIKYDYLPLSELLRGLTSTPEICIGGVAERSNATDCKSVDFSLRWFESIPLHHLGFILIAEFAGVAQW